MRLLLVLSFFLGLSHLGMGVDRSKYPYWPYMRQMCQEFSGQTCNLLCEDQEQVECDQYCDEREEPCFLHCPKVKLCYQECNAGQTCQRISCEAKECSSECVPSCKEMTCNSEKECYQRVGNLSLLAVSRTRASCSGNFCGQTCNDKLCDFTCDSQQCRQMIANQSQAICNARICEQACEGGDCYMECQRNQPNSVNCTQYSANGYLSIAGGPTSSPTEDTRRRRREGEEWGDYESSGFDGILMNATEPGYTEFGMMQTTVPIKSTAKCFSKTCFQICMNGTCTFESQGSERCYQSALGAKTEMSARCSGENCTQYCRQTKSCDITCLAKNCNMTCLSNSSSVPSVCHLRCRGDDVENCNMNCEGHSQCIMDCGNAKRCSHSGHVSAHSQSACLQLLFAMFAIMCSFMKI